MKGSPTGPTTTFGLPEGLHGGPICGHITVPGEYSPPTPTTALLMQRVTEAEVGCIQGIYSITLVVSFFYSSSSLYYLHVMYAQEVVTRFI